MLCRFGRWPLLALLLSVAVPFQAHAERADQSAICERAIVEGARRSGVPEGVLHAISLTETGRPDGGRLRPWPWAVNREGKGYWFATREEALAFARASLAAGRPSFDVSCFQINYRHHGMNFPSLEAMFDPDTSADYAAHFLRSLYAELGNWSSAAGAYHSRTPQRANVYRARFDRILAGLGGTPMVVAAAEPEPPAIEAPPRKSRTRTIRGPKIINLRPDPEMMPAAAQAQEAARDVAAPPVVLTVAPMLQQVTEGLLF
jgi:Transglycosylase SLT domain